MAPKTKEYTRRAIDKYRENKDVIYLTLEKGTKEKIETMTGEKAGAFIRNIVMEKIKDLENGPAPAADQEPKQETAEPEPAENETEKSEEKPAITWDVLAEMQKSGNFDFSKYQ